MTLETAKPATLQALNAVSGVMYKLSEFIDLVTKAERHDLVSQDDCDMLESDLADAVSLVFGTLGQVRIRSCR